MALTQASLSSKIQAEIINLYGVADDSAKLKDFADAIAKAVVDEIQANAVVTTTGTVTSGPGAGGTTASTGTVA